MYNFFEGREKILDAFQSKIISTKSKGAGVSNLDHSKLKVLTLKQMLQRLPIALAQVKASNNSESLLNEIRQIVYSLYQSKQITKKIYNNLIKYIQLSNGYYICELRKQKTNKPHVLILKLANKLDLRIAKRLSPYQIVGFITRRKAKKAHTKTINLKYLHQY